MKGRSVDNPSTVVILYYMGVSLNGGTPKSSILIGFSIINHPWVFNVAMDATNGTCCLEAWPKRKACAKMWLGWRKSNQMTSSFDGEGNGDPSFCKSDVLGG